MNPYKNSSTSHDLNLYNYTSLERAICSFKFSHTKSSKKSQIFKRKRGHWKAVKAKLNGILRVVRLVPQCWGRLCCQPSLSQEPFSSRLRHVCGYTSREPRPYLTIDFLHHLHYLLLHRTITAIEHAVYKPISVLINIMCLSNFSLKTQDFSHIIFGIIRKLLVCSYGFGW